MNTNKNIIDGAKTAFIDENIESSVDFKPKFLYNNNEYKVLNSIKSKLHDCDEFIISAAFITLGGLTPLLEDFLELEKRGVKGKILTTDYLNFTEPKALKKLQSLDNIEVKLYSQSKEGFHTKGYIFKKNDVYTGIIGSSNLTLNALTVNKEWNVELSLLNSGEILNNLLNEFQDLWGKADDLNDVLPYYEKIYEDNKNFNNLKRVYEDEISKSQVLEPNLMQKEFLKNLRELRKKNENKALLISATGTGKTYASAFAVKDAKPAKFLFLVHREQILKQAIETFKKVFGDESYKFGLLSGNSKDYDADYLFSTVQTFSKIYNDYNPNDFDFIVIDEVHKAGAKSYLEIINYFKPKFLLGMTASPERTDGFDIYSLFDHNIAHEIRLQEALNEDLLCPFHYFGISDITIEDKEIEDLSEFSFLDSDDRIDYLLEKSEYFGYSGDRIKALVFCRDTNEAEKLAKGFNERGHPSITLTGKNSQKEREDAIYRLTDDNAKNKVEYIFTVDIFNEGVDIPEINQVLLARPTESPIIFVQQLGRGLRKYKNKEYVVIIDFIGNYKNNFMIPLALSGDRSYDKDIMRRYLMEANRIIPGKSSINFDSISRERIYESINNTSFSKISFYKEKYNNLKYKLGRIPMLVDFLENGELDPILILNHNTLDSYYSFVKKVEKDYNEYIDETGVNILKFISKNLANGKRPHELLILKYLILNKYFTTELIEELLKKEYGIYNDKPSIESAINVLNLNFFTNNEKEKYEDVKFFTEELKIDNVFNSYLNQETFRKYILDLIDFGLIKYKNEFKGQTHDINLKLYAKYSRKDVCRLLNWPNDDSSTLYGYRIKHNACPIFVTYEKDDDISESTKYQDEFENKEIFSWMSRSNLKLDSKEIKSLINYKEEDLKIHLFVKKSDDEGKDFYYMGQVIPKEYHQTTIKNDESKELPIVNFKYKLLNPVKDELYNYFTLKN